MPVRPAALNAQRSAACALTRPRATAPLPNSSARCARTFATGAQKSVVHTTWITASAAPRLASSALQRAARWPLDSYRGAFNRLETNGGVRPLRTLAYVRCFLPAVARARRRARPGQGSNGLPRCAGCPAVLAFGSCRITRFACFAALRSNTMRQVRARSARVRAPTQSLCSSAAPIRPAQATLGALPANGAVLNPSHATNGCATGLRTRAAQGSRSEAKTAEVARWARCGCPVAARRQRVRTLKVRTGPNADSQIYTFERSCVSAAGKGGRTGSTPRRSRH